MLLIAVDKLTIILLNYRSSVIRFLKANRLFFFLKRIRYLLSLGAALWTLLTTLASRLVQSGPLPFRLCLVTSRVIQNRPIADICRLLRHGSARGPTTVKVMKNIDLYEFLRKIHY